MPPSQAVPGMVSLVTGDVYNKTEATPIDGGYSVMARYAKQYGALPQTISRPVDSAKQSYNATINAAAQAEKDPPISAMASATISFSDLLNAEPPSTGGFQLGLSSAAPSQIIQTKSNISQLQKEAAGTAIIQISDFSSSQPSSFSFNQDQSQPVEASAPSQQTSAFDTSTSIPQQQESTAPESSSTTDAFTLSGSSGFSFGGFGGSGGQAAAVEDIPIVTTAEPTSGRKINFSQQSSIPQTDTSAFEEPIQETISSSQNLPAISTAFDAFNTNPPVQTNISSSSNQSAFDTEFEQPPNQPTESTFDAFNSSPQAQQSVTSSPNQSAFNSDFEQQETSQNESAFDPFNTGQPAQTNVNPSSNQSAFNGGFEQEENQQTNSAFDPFNADQPAQTSSSAFDPFNTDQDSESAFDAPAQTTMTIRNASSDESLSTQEGSAPNSGDFSDEFSLSGSSGFAF